MMKKKKFVNRCQEIEYFSTEIKKETKKNKIFFIHSKSGIGKSALTEKILSLNSYRHSVKLPISRKEGAYKDGYYIKRLAESINNSAKDEASQLFTLQQFLKTTTGNALYKYKSRIVNEFLQNTILKILKPLVTMYERRKGKGEYGEYGILYHDIEAPILICYEYVRHILNEYSMIINIENIQLIDTTSLDLLKKILSETSRSNYYIFEYTIGDNYEYALNVLLETFSSPVNEIKKIELKRIEFRYVLELLDTNRNKALNLLKKAYVQTDGNLRSLLIDTEIIIKSEKTYDCFMEIDFEKESPTKLNIKKLQRDDLFILILIYTHRGKVRKSFIEDLSDRVLSQEAYIDLYINLEMSLNNLQNCNLVSIDDLGTTKIADDFVSSEIENDNFFAKYIVLAHKAWAIYYKMLLDDIETASNLGAVKLTSIHRKQEVLNDLCYFYMQSNPKKLFGLIEKIKEIAVNSFNPEYALRYLMHLRTTLLSVNNAENTIARKLDVTLIDIYYYIGLFNEGYFLLKGINTKSKREIVYEAIFLNRLDKFQESILFIKKALGGRSTAKNLSFELSLKLILMISYRSLSRISDCKKLFLAIEKMSKYKSCYEYGYYLRNADIALDYTESLDYIRQSVNFFKGKNKIHEGHARIGLVENLAKLGFLKEAWQEIKKAKELLEGRTMERHILFNNEAVLEMYSGNFSRNVERLLNLSEATITTPFDEILLNYNKLILLTNLKEYNRARHTVSKLIKLLAKEPDKLQHRRAYYNIAYFYKKVRNKKNYEANLQKARMIKSKFEPLWEYRLDGAKLDDPNYSYIKKFDFHLDFIVYWHFEIGNF